MLKKHGKNNRLSQPIVFLAITGIALGIAVMILSSSVASGFQKEIRDKVVGFGSHVQIEAEYGNQSFESNPMIIDSSFYKLLKGEEKIKHVQYYANKPAILQSKNKNTGNNNGKPIRDIEGIIFKGVDQNYNADFFKTRMLKGVFPSYNNNSTNDSIVISKYISNRLQLKINDKVSTFFIKEKGPKQRNLIIAGIYETGLEDFDKRFAFIDLNQIRKINSWGIQTILSINTTILDSTIVIKANSFGGNGNYKYSWNNGPYKTNNNFPIPINKDTVIKVVSSDFENDFLFSGSNFISLPDTAIISLKFHGKSVNNSNCNDLSLTASSVNENSYENNCFNLQTTFNISQGTGQYYTGGIEILLHDYNELINGADIVKNHVGPQYRISTIIERNQEIFNWLKMLDLNVYIIIGLMIAVAIINMTAALLVIILEKTQMIGILKSLGANNWSIRKIFIYNGGYLIIVGLIIGNLIGISIIFLQTNFEIITLPKENYFVSIVPMHLSIMNFISINLGAFLTCFAALIFPSYFITKITPIKAIRKE
jgi:lipoprotein-releasing system permease protein